MGNQSERVHRWRRRVKLAALVLLLLALGTALIFFPVRRWVMAVLAWTPTLGPWGPMAMTGVFIVGAVVLLPGTLLGVSSVLLFGAWTGAAIIWVGSTLGGCASFLMGRLLGRESIRAWVVRHQRLAIWDAAVGREAIKLILLLRLTPAMPYNILNYSLGLTRVPLWKFALATAVGRIPGTALYLYLGLAAESLAALIRGDGQMTAAEHILFWTGLGVSLVTFLLLAIVVRRAVRRTERQYTQNVSPVPVQQAQ